jgi:hypothetical protein
MNKSDTSMPMAFSVRHSELEEVFKEMSPTLDPLKFAFRFYLGYKEVTEEAAGGTIISTKPCLVIVAVSDFERDEVSGKIINPGTDLWQIEMLTDPGVFQSGCFDFTYPCPTTCQKESPLFNGIIPFL